LNQEWWSVPDFVSANGAPVGAAEGCEKVGTTFNGRKTATGSRSIAAFGSSYKEFALPDD
jgi:hypothetical protein